MDHTKYITYAILLIFLSGCIANNLSIEDAWARPGNQGDNSAVYLVIDNPTSHPDILTNAESDIAEFIEIHLSSMDDEGKVTMELQESVQVDPRTRLILQPGGLHIMLINIYKDLHVGDKFNLRLHFDEAGSTEIIVEIREP